MRIQSQQLEFDFADERPARCLELAAKIAGVTIASAMTPRPRPQADDEREAS